MASERERFQCEYCKEWWHYPISAAMCCDSISHDLGDDDVSPFTD